MAPLAAPQKSPRPAIRSNGSNRLEPTDRPVHDWYRFVLSYPPHLVRDYLTKFGIHDRSTVLDPFCGTGTTLVECKKLGIASVGIEANPIAHFASRIKTDWNIDADLLFEHAGKTASKALSVLRRDGIDDGACGGPLFADSRQTPSHPRILDEELQDLILKNSISPLPLHKVLVLRDIIRREKNPTILPIEMLALARTIVEDASNLHFGPEVGVGKPKADAPVISPWLDKIARMTSELQALGDLASVPTTVHLGDARKVLQSIKPNSIDAVITSPPYPNEKDYTRTTRLESVILGFISSKQELRVFKENLLRSNTRNVFKGDTDDSPIRELPFIEEIAADIDRRRIELQKTSGFEKLYGRVTRLYFGGMYRHLSDLRPALRPGAQLAYVVGDQASFFRIMIRTGQLLGQIAKELGYEVVGIDLFRTRLATATREQLREEVLILRWPGDKEHQLTFSPHPN